LTRFTNSVRIVMISRALIVQPVVPLASRLVAPLAMRQGQLMPELVRGGARLVGRVLVDEDGIWII
jgi:hypothetical protein